MDQIRELTKVRCRVCGKVSQWGDWAFVGLMDAAEDGFKLDLRNCPHCPKGKSNTQSLKFEVK